MKNKNEISLNIEEKSYKELFTDTMNDIVLLLELSSSNNFKKRIKTVENEIENLKLTNDNIEWLPLEIENELKDIEKLFLNKIKNIKDFFNNSKKPFVEYEKQLKEYTKEQKNILKNKTLEFANTTENINILSKNSLFKDEILFENIIIEIVNINKVDKIWLKTSLDESKIKEFIKKQYNKNQNDDFNIKGLKITIKK